MLSHQEENPGPEQTCVSAGRPQVSFEGTDPLPAHLLPTHLYTGYTFEVVSVVSGSLWPYGL